MGWEGIHDFLITYGWAIIIAIIAIGGLIIIGPEYAPESSPDYADNAYCIEWDGWIHTENMVYNCYDFNQQIVRCHWQINDNGTLTVYDASTGEMESYNCTRYALTERIKN